MLITCEKCQAVYSLSEKIIGINGRMVKCAKCDHTWMAKPQESVEGKKDEHLIHTRSQEKPELNITKETITEEENHNKPKKITKEGNLLKLLSLLLMIAIIFVSLIAFHNYLSKFPPLRQVYEKFGIFDNNGLILSDFNYQIIDENLIITGKLTNKSGIKKSIPDLRYIILDSQRKVIFSAVAKSSAKNIETDQTIPIYAKIANLSDQAAFPQLDLYNIIEITIENNYLKSFH